MPLNKDDLEEVVEELEQYKGRHTELISVYIPAGYDINSVQKQLEAETSTAKNIKSTSTRKNVTDALEKIIRHLKTLKKTPKNGLALFAGDISKSEGQQDIQLWAIEPPIALKARLYRCDKTFVLDYLKQQLEVSEVFGLLVMDRKEATIGVLEGKRIEVLQNLTSGVPSKVKAGGQSSQRFHRITEGLTKKFYKRIAKEMKKIFYDNEKLKGILVGGPIPTKDEFLDEEYLPTKLHEKVIGRVDIGGSDESGLKELVQKSQKILAKQEIIHEKQILEEFFRKIGEDKGMAVLKEEDTRRALKYGAVDTLVLSKGLDKELSKDLKKEAKRIDSDIEVISTETEEGEQFANLGGIGATLRFAV
ncbi:peptide chain release factor 1 [Candidatus Pacearchaeota archaeon]|nr:peptide chain release factor 1 [Candidatus Pacearchaeota archaeon]